VTESTKKAARCFYALSQNRADSKRYPAIEAVDSYSKYLEYEEFHGFIKENISEDWVQNIIDAKNILIRGIETKEQINILGDDGVPLDYHQVFWKAEVIDFVILQQDAFDKIDASTPIKRQQYMLKKVLDINNIDFQFDSFEEVAPFFKSVINYLRQMNYSEFKSDKFNKFKKELEELMSSNYEMNKQTA